MGLDIYYYAGLQPATDGVIVDGYDVVDSNGQYMDIRTVFHTHPSYPQWNQSVPMNQVFSWLVKGTFRAGSYAGYSYFRNWLESLVLQPDEVIEPGDPFYELIVFSDCEGVIDEHVSLKLLRDFMIYDHHARTSCSHDQFLYEIYQDFTHAFRFASVQGAVKFT